MKNVSDLKVTQVRVFPVDVIPFHYLYSPSAIEKIKNKFRFKETGKGAATPRPSSSIPSALTFPAESIVFGHGEYSFEDRYYPVENLVIESRRILITLVGSSRIANELYSAVGSLISEVDVEKHFDPSRCLLQSDETGCNATFEADIRQLFSDEFVKFLESSVLQSLSSRSWRAKIRGMRVGIELSYVVTDDTLTDNAVSLTPKVIILQSAPGTALDQKRVATFSPSDSDTHLEMLGKIEQLIRGKDVKPGP